MPRSLRILSILIFFLLISLSSGYARQVIYTVDLSAEMGLDAIGKARQMIGQRLSVDRQPAGLVGFTDQVRISLPPATFQTENLALLAPAAGATSLEVGLRASLELLAGAADEKPGRIVLFTAGSEESCRKIFRQFGDLLHPEMELEINVLANGAFRPPLLISQVEVKPENSTSRSLESVRNFLVVELGVPKDALREEALLATDFGIGQIEAYEIFVSLCDAHSVPSTGNRIPATIGEIAAYIDRYSVTANAVENAGESSAQLLESSVIEPPRVEVLAEQGADGLYVQQIFYGTNRQPTGDKSPENYFGGERSSGDPVRYGICNVSIPLNHKRGAVESPFLGLELFADPQKHIQIRELKPLSGKDFFKRLKTSVHNNDADDNWSKDLVVFVHGFNVTFADGAKRTAQIAFDFGFSGAPVMFSWPSDGQLYGYTSDREDATWSVMHIEQFLQDVRREAKPERMHLVAHSMGNQGLIGALNRIALKSGSASQPLFESITLAAPDFDAQLFEQQIAPGVVSLAKHWTIYTSDNDAALNVSSKVNSAKRLGLPVTPVKGVAVIDATGVEVTPWSVPEFHSYYATKQTVIEDIVAAIKGIAPEKRNLLPKSQNGIPYWKLDGI